jgi:hypothetical protein
MPRRKSFRSLPPRIYNKNVLDNLTLVSLERCDLERLLQLAIEGADLVSMVSESLAKSYYLLAAQCSLELWWRDWMDANYTAAEISLLRRRGGVH